MVKRAHKGSGDIVAGFGMRLDERKRAWRLEKARWLIALRTGIRPHALLRNEAVRAIAARAPVMVEDLHGLPRVDRAFIGYWGDFVIALLAATPGGSSPWRLAQEIADAEMAVAWGAMTNRQRWERKVKVWRERKARRAVNKARPDASSD